MMRLISLVLLATLASSLPGGAKEKIMERLDKYNFDVACWGKQNVWRMYRLQEAALQTCTGSYPALLPGIPQAGGYQTLLQVATPQRRFFFY